MKKVINYILSVGSLLVTLFLLVITMFSWYVTNTKAEAKGIVATTQGDNYSAVLERGIYSNGTWQWVETSELKITKMEPGNAFFFRFKISAQAACNLATDFTQNSSVLQSNLVEDNILTVHDDCISYYGVDIYQIENNEVTILDKTSGTDVERKLYSITDGNISLHEDTIYEISNTFRFYDYGMSNSANAFNTYDNVINTSTDTLIGTETNIQQYTLENARANYEMDESGVYYAYFALEFNDAASLVNYKHFDGNYYEDSNLYQFQTISFTNIGLLSL